MKPYLLSYTHSLKVSQLHVSQLVVESLQFVGRYLEGSEVLGGDGSPVFSASIAEAGRLQLEETGDHRDSIHRVLVLLVQHKLTVTASLPRPDTTRVSYNKTPRGRVRS